MPVFELEPINSYSGSMFDSIMSGSLVFYSGSILVGGSRDEVGSNVSGAFAGTLRTLKDFGRYSTFMSKSGTARFENHSPQFHCQLIDTNKQFYDSMVPSIHEAMNLDSKGLVLVNVPHIGGYHTLTFAYMFSVYDGSKLNSVTASVDYNGDGSLLSSEYWLTTPPFSNRYRKVRRIREFDPSMSEVVYVASCSFFTQSRSPIAGYATKPKETTAFTPSATDIFWLNNATFDKINSPPASFTVMYVTKKRQPGAVVYNYTALESMSLTGSVNSSLQFVGGYPGYPPAAWDVPSTGNTWAAGPDNYDVVCRLYGFGDFEVANIPEFGTSVSTSFESVGWLNHNNSLLHRYGTSIRGWKYGLLSGFPQRPKAVFRRNHYGMLRDMLEQRLYSKEILTIKNSAIESPVSIVFKSGSVAYVTASSQDTLNLTDSGIYDFEAKSRLPFSDT